MSNVKCPFGSNNRPFISEWLFASVSKWVLVVDYRWFSSDVIAAMLVHRTIGHFGKYHNTLCLSPQILHTLCFQFLLGLTMVPRENKNNAYVKFGGQTKSIMVFSEMAYKEKSFGNLTLLLCKTSAIICLVLFCAPTWPSYHMIENHLLKGKWV